ncbi:MAG: CAP domain-containing protein [bacterium]|nr:CAP domain-containing protein [bacterium]
MSSDMLKIAKKQHKITLALITTAILLSLTTVHAQSIAQTVAGRILIQVEKNGEAWYVNADGSKRYFLGRPADAFNVMKELGIGISNADLRKISVGIINNTNSDTDSDGLDDQLEVALGTSYISADSDGDGFNDYDEVLNDFDPLGVGSLPIDKNFTSKLLGKIFLQVERNGEAWYVNPADGKRYFLSRPADAFNIMRSLGLGISNDDLDNITAYTPDYLLRQMEVEMQALINIKRAENGLPALIWNDELANVAREHSDNLASENAKFTGMGVTCSYSFIHHEGTDFGLYHNNRLNNRGIYYFDKTSENIAIIPGASFNYTYLLGDTIIDELNFCRNQHEAWNEEFKAEIEAAKDEEKILIINNEISRREQAFAQGREINVSKINWLSQTELAERTVEGWMNSPGHRANIIDADVTEAGIGAAYINGSVISTQVFIRRVDCGYKGAACCEKEPNYVFCYLPYACANNSVCQ